MRLPARGRQHPGVEVVDEPALLRDGDELIGGDQSTEGMIPPDERLDARHVPRSRIHLGLVHEDELTPADTRPKILLQGEPLDGGGMHVLGKDRMTILAVSLSDIQRRIRVADDVGGCPAAR